MGDALGLLLFMVIAGIALVVFVPWFFYRKGRKAERRRAERIANEQKEEINDAIEASHSGGAAWHDRLREHRDG